MDLLTASTHSNLCKTPLQTFLPFCLSKNPQALQQQQGLLPTKWHRGSCYCSKDSCMLNLMFHRTKTSRPCPCRGHQDFTSTHGSHPLLVFGLKSIVVPIVQSPGSQSVSKQTRGILLFPSRSSHLS